MIFVTLGTQDKSFKRLLEAIDKQIDLGNIKDKIVVQAGYTKYNSNNMEIFDYISMEKFNDLMKACDILITHGGVGSINEGLKNNKKIIACARLKKFGEHTNDHQKEIIEEFSKEGYIVPLDDFDKLDIVLEKIKTFKPKEYKSNTVNMIKLLNNYIKNNDNKISVFRILVVILMPFIVLGLIALGLVLLIK